MSGPGSVTKESRHLWVGGLPDTIDEPKIKDYFSRYGKVEGVKILPQKYPKMGLAAFVDFYDVKSAVEAKEAKHKLNGQELRTNFKTKSSEKFTDSGAKKYSDDEAEDKKGNDHRSSTSHSESESDVASKSSSGSDSDNKAKRKKDSLLLKITGLPRRPERVLQDGLYYEYTRYSSSVEIRMYGDDSDKWAIAKFKKLDKCKQAQQQTQGLMLFGSKIKVSSMDADDFPPGGRDEAPVPSTGSRPLRFEEVDPQATRSLFVGNIPKNISVYDVRDAFQRYGSILDVEIKKMGGTATYGFVLYYDLSSAIVAKKYMDGQNLKGNNIRVGFGKGTNSKQLWVDGVDIGTSRQQLERYMSKYGKVIRLGIDYQRNCAMVQYDSVDSAKKALEAVRGAQIGSSRRLMTDFANRDARAAFFSHVDRLEMEGAHQPYPGPGMYPPGMMDPGFRGGMMMPGGMPMMGMGRGGYHHQGPPMDYMYDPYLEGGMGYYGGRPPFPPGRGHPVPMGMGPYPGGQYEDDYEEELAAYKRKRDWEKERERRKSKKKQRSSSSESSSDSDSSHKKKKRDKHKKAAKKQKHKKKTEEESGEESSSDEGREELRLKATKKSKEHRDKSKKKASPQKHSESDSDNKKKKRVTKPVSKSRDSGDEQVPKPPKEVAKPKSKEKSPPPPASPPPDDKSIKSSEKPRSPPPAKEPTPTPDRRPSVASSLDEPGPKSSEESRKSSEPSRKSSVDNEAAIETPQSPPAKTVSKSSMQVESDWSSGEEFKSSDNNEKVSEGMSPVKQEHKPVKQEVSKLEPSREPSPREPVSISDSHVERASIRAKHSKHLPRRYQTEDGSQDLPSRRENRSRDPRSNKRYLSGPSSPSPPPPGLVGPSHRSRRLHYSPPPEQYERVRRHRPHPSRSHHRRHSRSPQRFQSPGYKGKSLSPRPRSPPPRIKDPHRHHHEAPPGEAPRGGRYSHRGSPHSPSYRHQHSMSPPFPRSPGRKRIKRRSPSLSPPRRSPGRGFKRDKSPVIDTGRTSPRYRVGKRGHFSRTPSPKSKYQGMTKEDKSEPKRRRLDEARPKSPTNPPPPKGSGGYSPHHSHGPPSGVMDSPGPRPAEPPLPKNKHPPPEATQSSNDNLMDLLRRYPVMWQGHLTLKNDSAAVQLHFLSGNVQLAKLSLPQPTEQQTPALKIAQRMRLEKTQLEGVGRRIQNEGEHCLLLALPCGRDASDVHVQTNALKNTFITYLIQKQAAGIINVPGTPQTGFVLHIFPPCPFSQVHLSRVAPDLLSSASDNCHLMIVVATM